MKKNNQNINNSNKKIVIVGAGMAGLTAAAYLSREKYDVLLIEKNKETGGLLNSFERDGFVFDSGARSIENSGIIRPMLNDLGIEIELLSSDVSLGIEDEIIHFSQKEDVYRYKEALERLYPESIDDIKKIFSIIEKILRDMNVLYGIDNPNFKDLKNDREYIFKELLPWLGKFFRTIYRINKMNEPVEPFLEQYSTNQSLIDIIDQHFFKNTPTFFALGYFYVYIDYFYPRGGTGKLPQALEQKIQENGSNILFQTEIIEVNALDKIIKDTHGNEYNYDRLIWAADLKRLYSILSMEGLKSKEIHKIKQQKEIVLSKRGGDSILTVFLGLDQPKESFEKVSNGHFFYTPSKKGLGEIHRSELQSIIKNFDNTSREEIFRWLEDYCRFNTYEISIPSLRDPSLSPEGKTGLIISFLFEYELIKKIHDAGWYVDFKTEVEKKIIKTIEESVYPFIKDKILFKFSSTPLSISKRVGSSEGGITGWAFEPEMPVINKLQKVTKSVKTPISNILQAGQWSYSPSGIPIAILTGWIAAQHIIKNKK